MRVFAVYFAGILQGIALVAFPAASSILTNSSGFSLSHAEYGSLFAPQSALSIGASLVCGTLTRRMGIKAVFLLGLFANFFSMALLSLSQLAVASHSIAYVLLLLATSCLGLGFGLTVPIMNRLVALYFPKNVDTAILVLNALLGLGTALAPSLTALFLFIGYWWGLPAVLVVGILFLFFFSIRLTFDDGIGDVSPGGTGSVFPFRFWLFAACAMLYGIIETVNGNWSVLFMKTEAGADHTLAMLALTGFWTMVTIGRLLFASIEQYFPQTVTYRLLPIVAAFAFIWISYIPSGHVLSGILAFSLAGLGCSALLPLTISFGTRQLPSISLFIPGGVIAFYLFGYGIAAFGVGAIGLGLRTVFALSTLLAIALGVLSTIVVRKRED